MPVASAIFLFVGLGVTLLGVILILLARFEKPPTQREEAFDPAKIIEQINKMLELVEQKYRIGIVLMAVGLSLVGVGVYLEAKAAKDEVKKTAVPAVVFAAARPRSADSAVNVA